MEQYFDDLDTAVMYAAKYGMEVVGVVNPAGVEMFSSRYKEEDIMRVLEYAYEAGQDNSPVVSRLCNNSIIAEAVEDAHRAGQDNMPYSSVDHGQIIFNKVI